MSHTRARAAVIRSVERAAAVVRARPVTLVAAGLLLVPLVVSPTGWQRYVALRWLVLALLVTVGLWLVRRRAWQQTPRAIRVGWLALLAAVGASIVTAVVPVTALLGDSARRGGWLTLVLLLGAYLVGVAARPTRALVLRAGPVGTAVVAAAIGVTLLTEPVTTSMRVLVGNSGLLGGWLVVLLGADLAVGACDPDRRWRIAGRAAAVACVPAIALTGSYSAVLGAVALGGAALVLVGWGRAPVGVRIGGSAAALVLLGVAVAWSAQFRPLADSVRGRIDTWAVSLDVVLARPVLGWGPEGFRHGFAQLVPADFVARYGDELVQDRAHMLLLDEAAASGLIGLAAVLLLAAALARHLDLGDLQGRLLVATLAGTAVFLTGWFPAFDVAAATAVLAGLATRPREESKRGGRSPSLGAVDRYAPPALLAVVALTVVVAAVALVHDHRVSASLRADPTEVAATDPNPVVLASSPLAGFTDLLAAVAYLSNHPDEARVREARQSVAAGRAGARSADAEWAIVEGQLAVLHGRLTGDASDVRAGIAAFEEALTLAPNHSVAWSRLGNAALLLGDPRAVPALERAAALRPDDVGPRYNLALAALREGDVTAARAWFDEVCAIDPDDPAISELAAAIAAEGEQVSC